MFSVIIIALNVSREAEVADLGHETALAFRGRRHEDVSGREVAMNALSGAEKFHSLGHLMRE